MANSNEILATGRRKCAVARVRMVPGTGKVTVNGKNWEEYFTTEALRGFIAQPFVVFGRLRDCGVYQTRFV